MDGSRFDALTQRLASIRLSRKRALHGLVGSVAAVAGGAAFTDGAEAKKGKKSVCHCEAGGACTTEKVKKKQRKSHLRDHQCDYLDECRSSITACAAAPILIDIDLLDEPCSRNSDCGGANSGLLCDLGLALPVCVPSDLGKDCQNDGQCRTGRCEGGVCVACPGARVCGTGVDTQCCRGLAVCVPGLIDLCVLP